MESFDQTWIARVVGFGDPDQFMLGKTYAFVPLGERRA
jgi:hypothetical protein